MFITAVCVIFLIKLRWPKTKSLYDKVCFPRVNRQLIEIAIVNYFPRWRPPFDFSQRSKFLGANQQDCGRAILQLRNRKHVPCFYLTIRL